MGDATPLSPLPDWALAALDVLWAEPTAPPPSARDEPPSPALLGCSAASFGSTSAAESTPPPTDKEEEERLERQRARARAKAQRAYYRKMARRRAMRDEVEQLERRLARIKLEQRLSPTADASDADQLVSAGRGAAPTTRIEIQARLRRLLEREARFREENYQLQLRLAAMSGVASRLEEIQSREATTPYITFASQVLFLRPLTPPECAAIHRRAMKFVRIFTLNDVLKAPLLRKVAGWYERREVDGGLFRYALQKRFPYSEQLEKLAKKSFSMCVDPESMRRCYTEGLDVQVRLMQKVDDHNYLLFQQMRAMDADNELAVIKGLILVSLVQMFNGYRIHIYGLDGDQIPLADRQAYEDLMSPVPVIGSTARSSGGATSPTVVEIWNGQFCWTQLEEVPAERALAGDRRATRTDGKPETDCLVTYAGVTPTVGSNAHFWMTEVVLHTLRWEQGVMAPLVTLTPSA